LTLLASLAGGLGQALGEVTLFGIVKGINSFCVSGLSTGSGLSGVFTIVLAKFMDVLKDAFGNWVTFSFFSYILFRPHLLYKSKT
jgi:hypothetical protein